MDITFRRIGIFHFFYYFYVSHIPVIFFHNAKLITNAIKSVFKIYKFSGSRSNHYSSSYAYIADNGGSMKLFLVLECLHVSAIETTRQVKVYVQ